MTRKDITTVKPQTIAAFVLKAIAAFLGWLRRQPPKLRLIFYIVGLLIAVIAIAAILITIWLVPEIRPQLKSAWLYVSPIVLLITSGLAAPNVRKPATTDDSNFDPAMPTERDTE